MAEIRVFELAKEFGIESKELIPKLLELGIKVVNQMSGLSESDVIRIRIELKGLAKRSKVDEKRLKGGVIRRRKKSDEEPEEEKKPKKAAAKEPAVEKKPVKKPKKIEKEESVEAEKVTEKSAASESTRRKVKRIPQPTPAVETDNEALAKETQPKEEKSTIQRVIPKPIVASIAEEEEELKSKKKVVKKTLQEFKPADFLKAERVFTPVRKKVVRGKGREMLKPTITEKKASKRVVKMEANQIVIADFAKQLGVKGADIIKKLMDMGTMLTINQTIDLDTVTLIANEYQYEVERIGPTEESLLPKVEDKPSSLKPRPPVVTVMGHVDHGKTSLLDAIRKTNVIAGEAGGITQHIGAYTVSVNKKSVTFLDTPGHEAFTAMRARGAQVTDMVILVVAADDGIMPQTVEAIHHARDAKVPIVVAINKIDKPGANPDRIKQQLTEHELVPEDWGGETIVVPISAKTGDGIPALLEMLLIQSEVLELKANPDCAAKGVIIEAKLDKGRGPVATALIKNGTLNIGDLVVAGISNGRVRGMFDDQGKQMRKAPPATAVEIIGLDTIPAVGDTLDSVPDEKTVKSLVDLRLNQQRALASHKTATTTLEELYQQIQEGAPAELRIIIKADVGGSVEALRDAIFKLATSQVRVSVIHGGVGAVSENDVNLAAASRAMIIAFHVRPDSKAKALAELEGIEIKTYRVIYEAVQDIRASMEGLLAPEYKEAVIGHAEVRQIFSVPKIGVIAGCSVTDGKIVRNGKIRLLRDNVVVHEGDIHSLKRFKDDAKEVKEGYECGIGIQNFNDIKPNDVLECFIMEAQKVKLESNPTKPKESKPK